MSSSSARGAVIYLDSSALLKLVLQERESDALAEWLVERQDVPAVSSQLAVVEVLRACRRLDPGALPTARVLLDQLDLVPLTGAVVQHAGELADPRLRSLDALHLAGAVGLAAVLTTFVAYDRRLADAAGATGAHRRSTRGLIRPARILVTAAAAARAAGAPRP